MMLFKIILSFFVALCLQSLPWSLVLGNIAPQWVTLALIYWVLKNPHKYNLITAWLLGFFLDGLSGSIIGLHGMALLLVAYFAATFAARIQMFHLFQQMVIVASLCWLNVAALALILAIFKQPHFSGFFWLSPLLSAIVWGVLSNFKIKKGYDNIIM